jgi:hypothetical protein
MLWSGSASRTVVRDSVWGLLLFAGAAWLAVGWCVLRLAPADVVAAATAVLFFGALCEVVRALVGMSTWWLNAGMAVLFAATGVVVLVDRGEVYTTPLSLVAWFLLVRGALDVAVSVMNRGVDRTWGLVMTLGLVQAGLGFYASTPQARAVDPVILTLGALSVLRGLADLTTSLRLREVAHAQHDVLALPPERHAGMTGYGAGRADYEEGRESPRAAVREARHRAGSFHDEVVRTTADLDTMIKKAGVTGTGAAQHRVPDDLPSAPDTAEGVSESAAAALRGGENA